MAVRTAAASALLLLAACIAAVSADGGEDAPKMELSDGNLVWSLQQGKTVGVQSGDGPVRYYAEELDTLSTSVSAAESRIGSIDGLESGAIVSLEAVDAELSGGIHTSKQRADGLSQVLTSVSSSVGELGSELSSEMSMTASDLSDAIGSVSDSAGATSEAVADLESSTEMLSSSVEAQGDDITSHTGRLDVLRRDLECAGEDRSAIYDVIKMAFEDIVCPTSEDNGNGNGGNDAAADRGIAVVLPRCDENICDTTGVEDVDVYARGSLFSNAPGVYTCRYTIAVAAADDIVLSTPALAVQLQGAGTFQISCKTPDFAPESVPASEFTAVFEVLEGDKPLPFQGAAESPLVKFHAIGPVIAPIAAYNVYASELKRDGNKYPDEKIVVGVDVTDVDTAQGDIDVTGTSGNTDLLPNAGITFQGTGEDRTMTLALNMEKVDELGAASTVSVYTVTITIRAKDIHDLESTRDVVITIVPHSDQLAFQLATGDGVNRHWGDPLWSGGSALAAGSANSYLNANIDIRTQSFATMHLGPRIRFEWVLAGDVKATAIYNVFPQYQQKTWLELFSGGWNQHIASKDTLASTPGRPLVDAGFVRNANGNNGQQAGDPFFDYDDDLIVNRNGFGGANGAHMRLATNLNHGGGHVYAFAGGWHKHGDWCTSYEYQPVIGYCGTHTRFGTIAQFPPWGGCGNHPYHGGCLDGNIVTTTPNLAVFVMSAV